MLIVIVIWAIAALVLLLASADALRRRVVGEEPSWTRRHLVWVIVALAAVVGSMFLLPLIVLVRNIVQA